MESQKFMKKLPIGFRFHPTDEELIVHYLRRKALSVPLPASVIPEFNVFETYPWNLPGSGSGSSSSEELREKMYFFGKSNQSGNRCIRVLSGYWKPIGKKKQVVGSGSNQPVGFKRILIFYQGKSRTNWIIYEFRLLGLLQKVLLKDWVVYKVFQKKRKPSNNNKKRNFMVEHNSHMPASQTSTHITDLSSTTEEEDDEEEEVEQAEEETSLVFLP